MESLAQKLIYKKYMQKTFRNPKEIQFVTFHATFDCSSMILERKLINQKAKKICRVENSINYLIYLALVM